MGFNARKPVFGGKQRCRPDCASAQSDQRLCYSHIGKNHIWTCFERNFNFLSSLCSWVDWFASHFTGNPEKRFVATKPICVKCKCKLISLFLKQIFISPIHTEACSWRSGSRCYPGTCSDTTTNSCQCSEGFSGADCDISNLFVIMWILNCKKAKNPVWNMYFMIYWKRQNYIVCK